MRQEPPKCSQEAYSPAYSPRKQQRLHLWPIGEDHLKSGGGTGGKAGDQGHCSPPTALSVQIYKLMSVTSLSDSTTPKASFPSSQESLQKGHEFQRLLTALGVYR